jgi:hypothetical protein
LPAAAESGSFLSLSAISFPPSVSIPPIQLPELRETIVSLLESLPHHPVTTYLDF